MLDSLSHDHTGAADTALDYGSRDQDLCTGPTVLHEGHSIVIDIPTGLKRDTVMLPLRNGFPIHASDRLAPVFALYNHFHEVVGLAMKIRGFGLSVHFHKPVPGGRFYFHISGPVGAA